MKTSPLAIMALSVLVTPTIARAQDRSPARNDQGRASAVENSDIVVTGKRAISATKTETPIVETPESISVITRDRMDRQGVTDNLTEILRYVPGVQAEPFGFDPRVDRFAIRGFDASGFGLYRDSLQLPSFGDSDRSFRIEPYGLERLEVLRGPSSVLYGNGSLGGLVNAISKRSTQEPLAEIELEAGNFDRYAGKFDVGGPIDRAGTFSYRLTGLARDSDTQVDFGRNNRLYIAPALTWRPDADTSFTVLSHYQKSTTAGAAQSLPASGTLFVNPNGQIPVHRSAGEPDFENQEAEEYSIGYALEHRFSDVFSVRQNARYDHLDVDAKSVYGAGLDPADPDQRRLLRFSFTGVEEVDAIAIDNQAQADFATGPITHTLLLGLEYKHVDFDDAQGFDSAPAIDIFDPDYGAAIAPPPLFLNSNTKQSQTGLYLHERAKFFDHWVLSLGGRQDFVSKKRADRLGGTRAESDDNAFSGSAGLLYLADNGLAPYVSYSESFLPTFGTDRSGDPFDPETGKQYEAGLKYQPPGQDSFVSVAGFELTRQNVLTPDPQNLNFSVQTGEQRSRGVEVEAVASLLQLSLNLTAAYTYQDAEVTRSNSGDVGNRPSTVPEQIASFYADYSIPDGALFGLGFGAGVRYQGSTFGDQANSFKVDGFTIVDASVRYDWRELRFAINAHNLFDKEYVADCFSRAGCNYGAARTVVGTVRYRF